MQLRIFTDQDHSPLTRWRVRLVPLSLALVCLFGPACERQDEWRVRIAVKGLATAPERHVPQSMAKVVAFGRLALVDIEQVIQGAEEPGRLRLMKALRKIGDPEAIPLLQIIARWDPSKTVRQEAQATIKALPKLK